MAQVSSACTCLNYYGNTMVVKPAPGTTTANIGTLSTISPNPQNPSTAVLSSTMSIVQLSSTFASSLEQSTLSTTTALPASPSIPRQASSSASSSKSTPLSTSKGSDQITSPNKSAPTPFSLNAYCYANNCLLDLRREGGFGATAFYSSFTKSIVTDKAALPTYASQCSTNAISQMSSACTCIGSKAYATA